MLRVVAFIVSLSRARSKGAMEPLKVLPIPTLPLVCVEEILRIRQTALNNLLTCNIPGTSYLSHAQALEVMCAYATADLDIRLNFYMARADFQKEWFGIVVWKTIDSILGSFPQLHFELKQPDELRTYETPVQFVDDLEAALWFHTFERAKASGMTQTKSLPAPHEKNRQELKAAYIAQFKDVRILDICWAANQHYSEWKRWLRHAVKDGSAPDRAFRALLESCKTPQEYRKQPRPDGWK